MEEHHNSVLCFASELSQFRIQSIQSSINPSEVVLGKPWLMRSFLCLTNGFSSSSLRTAPCSINGCGVLNLRNVTKGRCRTYFAKKVQPEEDDDDFTTEDHISLVTSTGWSAHPEGDGGILTIMNNHQTKVKEHRIISLPPFVALPHCQTQIVTSVDMSSSCPDEEDCVVAVKFLGPQISFIRPAQINSGWTNVRIKNACLHFSQVSFSKKHGVFRIPGAGGHVIGSWDVHNTYKQTQPKLQMLRLRNFPNLTQTQHELLDSCCTRTILLDSISTDDTFLVKWYRKTSGKILRTKSVMVFRIDDDQLNALYTQDIGDLCIYLGETDHCCDIDCLADVAPDPYSVSICDDHEFLDIDLAGSPIL